MKKTQSKIKHHNRSAGFRLFLMTIPFLALLFLFSYYPLYGWRYAFYVYKPGLPLELCEFVGWKHFTLMFTNKFYRDDMLRALTNTLGLAGIGLATSWLPMFFAILLSEIHSQKYKKLVQTLTTIPHFISWTLVYAIAFAMFSVGDGFVNKVLIKLGVIEEGINFLAEQKGVWLKMWLWGTWKGLGWSAITYLAAIAGIDHQLYEAALVDGANRWQRIWHVTMPGLIPTFFVLFIISVGNILSSGIEQYYVFSNPMIRKQVEVLDLYVFNLGVGQMQYSYTTAVGALKSIVAITLMSCANWLSKVVRGTSVF